MVSSALIGGLISYMIAGTQILILFLSIFKNLSQTFHTGLLVDKAGRKFTIVVNCLIFTLASFLLAFAQNFTILVNIFPSMVFQNWKLEFNNIPIFFLDIFQNVCRLCRIFISRLNMYLYVRNSYARGYFFLLNFNVKKRSCNFKKKKQKTKKNSL